MHDKTFKVIDVGSPHYKKVVDAKEQMSGFCHVLAFISHKAKRISSSTSTAETLAGVHGKELAQLVAMRLTEVLGHGTLTPWMKQTPMSVLIDLRERDAG